ncbi:hypothetical protein HA402_009065 [Bradysia odoriphaga]|nr:hypothetical protein HA402_009065 [Bradysia odoriphaga]
MVGFAEKCLKETNADIKKLEEFTFAHDLTNLPDDRSLKCYMACIFRQYQFLQPDNPRLQLQTLFNVFPAMTDDERSHFLKMASGCTKLRAKDPCDAVYIANVCMKRNANDYYYIPYDVEYWSNRNKNGK